MKYYHAGPTPTDGYVEEIFSDVENNPHFNNGMFVVVLGCMIGDTTEREIIGYGVVRDRFWDWKYDTHRYTLDMFTGERKVNVCQQDMDRHVISRSVLFAYMKQRTEQLTSEQCEW